MATKFSQQITNGTGALDRRANAISEQARIAHQTQKRLFGLI